MSATENVDHEALNTLIEEVSASGGAETANTQIFIERLTKALNLPTPDFAGEANEHNDYTFERRVDFKFPDGSTSIGRIDCYKRDSFVLEAKQSSKRKRDTRQLDMLSEDAKQKKLGTAKRGTVGWDKSMRAARKQAESYARALPVSHGYPPFLIVLDVGNVIEIYADFSGQGKNYAQFPDRNSYRLTMEDLRDADVQDRLRKIWLEPQSLNPALISAVVTRDIAKRLARIAKTLEGKHDSEVVAHFLMRCLFTMFAEDVALIEPHSFENLLKDLVDNPAAFPAALEALWKQMDAGGYDMRTMKTIRHFNGGLFSDCRALPLDAEAIHELHVAAVQDWSDVEPAIFGTLLEQALDPRERGKLGAHYTPRAYVERLVIPTIIEPLRADWEDVLARVNELHDAGDDKKALKQAQGFHKALCMTRVLDPACGTGNFLYVALELMKRLEGEVLEVIRELGGQPERLFTYGDELSAKGLLGSGNSAKVLSEGGRFSVNPSQFFGLDLNARAVAIADLVLWIGHIKWQLRTSGLSSISDPVLEKLGNIKHQDAILDYDSKTLAVDEEGKPITRWNGYSYKTHPITGNDVPDPAAQVESYTYAAPTRAKWPEAEFIVGNPPFIGGKDMRAELGDGYAEAAWKARPKVPGGADFVMHFWDEAAQRLGRKPTKSKPNSLRRFGFITTNSITQTFSRRVVEAALSAKSPISLVFAVPDHPWMKGSDKAAVQISMTVAERGKETGIVGTVSSERDLDTDAPSVDIQITTGYITARLRLGADFSLTSSLISQELLSSPGVKLHGKDFKVSEVLAKQLNSEQKHNIIKPYRNGRDLAQSPRNIMLIDTFGLSERQLKTNHPSVYQHLLDNIRPHREANRGRTADATAYADEWWLFGKNRPVLRSFLNSVGSYIATGETSKHRFFELLSEDIIPDNMIIAIGSSKRSYLATLSSRLHVAWMLATGGLLGPTPRYNKTKTFDPFPFPACVTNETNPDFRDRLSALGERLDVHRKSVMKKHDHLTMTGMYNVLERVRELEAGIGDSLSPAEKDVYDAALIGILKEIHDDIDRATLEAYGWSDLAPNLIGKVGATLPSPHKSPKQEAAEETLLSRLVALNIERREEERTGHVRWLRPDYQIPKLGHKVKAETKDMDIAPVIVDDAPAWPKDGLDQIKLVRELLARSDAPVLPAAVSASFKGRNTPKRKTRVVDVLDTLVAAGVARQVDSGAAYYLPR